MGFIVHTAIIVTSWDVDLVAAAAIFARYKGLTVIGPSAPLINSYCSMMVCPDGSKKGWKESDLADERRASFVKWLNLQRYEDGSSALEWLEVAYGNDLGKANIVECNQTNQVLE